VSRAAYLLFYRRRSAGPLGPPKLQEIVNAWWSPGSETANESDEATSRTQSPAGNGLRLDGSSRNGSSSAFAAGAGAAALRGAGSGAAGNRASSAAEAETHDELPDYEDEGYGAGDDDRPGQYNALVANPQNWNFDNLSNVQGSAPDDGDVFDDDTSSNAPNMAGEELDDRLLTDFGDELGDVGHHHPGTPEVNVQEGMPRDDDDVVDIRISPTED
jgi:ubiquitin carboxyl-terminal hydrolase 4/11/15